MRLCMSNLDRTTLNWRIKSINYHKRRSACGNIVDRIIILMAEVLSPTVQVAKFRAKFELFSYWRVLLNELTQLSIIIHY